MNGLLDNIKDKLIALNNAVPDVIEDHVMSSPWYRQLAWVALAPLFVLLVNILAAIGFKGSLLLAAITYTVLCNVVYWLGCHITVSRRNRQTIAELKGIVNVIRERRRQSFKGDDGSVK